MEHGQDRITTNPQVLGGKPCIRDLRLPVQVIREFVEDGYGDSDILALYPLLEPEDLDAVRAYIAHEQIWKAGRVA